MHVDVIALLQGRDSDTVKCYYREQWYNKDSSCTK
jgi:hypothetical protein